LRNSTVMATPYLLTLALALALLFATEAISLPNQRDIDGHVHGRIRMEALMLKGGSAHGGSGERQGKASAALLQGNSSASNSDRDGEGKEQSNPEDKEFCVLIQHKFATHKSRQYQQGESEFERERRSTDCRLNLRNLHLRYVKEECGNRDYYVHCSPHVRYIWVEDSRNNSGWMSIDRKEKGKYTWGCPGPDDEWRRRRYSVFYYDCCTIQGHAKTFKRITCT